jgi:hypothetical protein
VLLLFAGAAILGIGHGLIFFSDEWVLMVGRLDGGFDTYLEPHNEHLLAVPIFVFKGLFATVGVDDYSPYRLAVVAVHLVCLALVFMLVRRRHGAWVSLFFSLPLLFLGAAWETLLFPINLGFLASLTGGLGALLLLRRRDAKSSVACSALLLVALASSSLGLSLAFGILAGLLWDRQGWRRTWVALVPLAVYVTWYLAYNVPLNRQGPVDYSPDPEFVFELANAAVAGYLGLPIGIETLGTSGHGTLLAFAKVTTVLGLLALGWAIAVRRRFTPGAAMAVVALGSYWVLLAVSRGDSATFISRYIYPGVVLIVLLASELAPPGRPRRGTLTAFAAVAVAAGALNLNWLLHDARDYRREATILRAELSALEIARPEANAQYPLDPPRTAGLTAGLYFAAIDRLGSSPAADPAELATEPEYARLAADDVLLQASGVAPAAYQGAIRASADAERQAHPPRIQLRHVTSRVRRRGRCQYLLRRGQETVRAELALPTSGLVLYTYPPGRRAVVRLRRFADGFPGPGWHPEGEWYWLKRRYRGGWRLDGGTYLTAPRGRSSRPWIAQIWADGASVAIC